MYDIQPEFARCYADNAQLVLRPLCTLSCTLLPTRSQHGVGKSTAAFPVDIQAPATRRMMFSRHQKKKQPPQHASSRPPQLRCSPCSTPTTARLLPKLNVYTTTDGVVHASGNSPAETDKTCAYHKQTITHPRTHTTQHDANETQHKIHQRTRVQKYTSTRGMEHTPTDLNLRLESTAIKTETYRQSLNTRKTPAGRPNVSVNRDSASTGRVEGHHLEERQEHELLVYIHNNHGNI